jgi:hypothetical protein
MRNFYRVAAAILFSVGLCLAQTPPAPPTTFTTVYPDTTGYKSFTCCQAGDSYTDLQTALNDVHNQGGDAAGEVISLDSNVTITVSAAYVLPAYTMSAGKWVIVTTGAGFTPPVQGTRVSPAVDAPTMARLLTSTTSGIFKTTATGVNHYWFMGIEMGQASGVSLTYTLFVIGNGETASADVPNNIVVDRCYLHGNGTGNIQRGVAANGSYIAVVDSYLANFAYVGAEAQAIGAWNAPGPVKIVNNFLEGAGENILIGGADPTISGLVQSDFDIEKNWFYKPLGWWTGSPYYAGTHWQVNNLLEFKNAQRVLVKGNVFENCWADAQAGWAILFTPKNQGGTAPQSTVQDMNFTYNFINHSANGLIISAGIPSGSEGGPSTAAARIAVTNNLFADLSNSYGATEGMAVSLQNTPSSVVLDSARDDSNILIQHNTFLNANGNTMPIGPPSGNSTDPNTSYAVVEDNIAEDTALGLPGTACVDGAACLDKYWVNSPTAGYWVWTNNALFRSTGAPSGYPGGNFWPTTLAAIDFTSTANCTGTTLSSVTDCGLTALSPYHNAGTDGKDIGVDAAGLSTAISGVVPGGGSNPAVSFSSSYLAGAATGANAQ